jgi:WD40 repeat protein
MNPASKSNIAKADTFFGHSGSVLCVDFCDVKPGVEVIVTGGEDSNIIVWPATSDARSKKLSGHTGPVTALKCHGGRILSASRDRTIRITSSWSSSIKPPKSTVVTAHSAPVTCLDITSDKVASGSHDKCVKIYDLPTLKFNRSITAHSGILQGVAFSDDGNLLASVGADRKILVSDLRTHGICADFLAPEGTRGTCVTFAPDSDAFVVGFSDGSVRLYDASAGTSGQLYQTYTNLHSKRVTGVQFSSFNPKVFVTGSEDGRIAIVDGYEGVAKRILDAKVSINALALSRKVEGKLCIGGNDSKVELWNVDMKSAEVNRQAYRDIEEDELDVTVGQVEADGGGDGYQDPRGPRQPRRSIYPSRRASGNLNSLSISVNV